jgi:hypothetical protein
MKEILLPSTPPASLYLLQYLPPAFLPDMPLTHSLMQAAHGMKRIPDRISTLHNLYRAKVIEKKKKEHRSL